MYKVEDDAHKLHTHACGQQKGQGMLLLWKCIELYGNQEAIHNEKCQVQLKDIMHLEWELMLKGVDVLLEGVAVDQPDVIVDGDVSETAVLPEAGRGIGSVVVACHYTYVPESANTSIQQVKKK